ncbi:ribosomal protein S18 acetylase RimI-like enzyme [Deinobacterium chartae]|uniref:Ribosomal protein S18 acetylase RimI-like enzyme n=1 Tax=Deinobacterium chartae TaxID=521158 RepID=A0A841HYP9_9DEIO|nr:GNAT family N-acetyltransferase [Deinobacterium chartae]MBB6097350.1 ribosomal protein S18 acetylase RimI-like enzyme [Deinobacterium chartae]
MHLRPLDRNDAPTVRSWLSEHLTQHRAWWSKAWNAEPIIPLEDVIEAEWNELAEAASAASSAVLVAEHGGTALGVVYVRTRPDAYMGFTLGVLSWIYVDEPARGHGVANALMQAAHRWMDTHSVRGHEVFVTAANSAAVKLYERHGYRVVDHRMLGSR